eukprot:scaffold47109_cov20-Prasinocladus_malaysianus.AAC.1
MSVHHIGDDTAALDTYCMTLSSSVQRKAHTKMNLKIKTECQTSAALIRSNAYFCLPLCAFLSFFISLLMLYEAIPTHFIPSCLTLPVNFR